MGRLHLIDLNDASKHRRPYQKLVADVSEFRYGNKSQDERVYLEPILDLFNGEVLAFNISNHPTVEFAVKPLKEALNQIPVLDYRTTVHTDQGFQYQHHHWQIVLKDHRAFQSMSRKGNCYDNSVMENFFGILKQEMYYGTTYYSFEELKDAIERYIKYYNEKRIKEKLGWMSPVEYRLNTLAA